MKKITNAIVKGMTNGSPRCCWATTCDSVTFPANNRTATVLIPRAISYEIICAEARSPPSSAYLLLDAQPASTIPYTPSELIARIYRNPTGRSFFFFQAEDGIRDLYVTGVQTCALPI